MTSHAGNVGVSGKRRFAARAIMALVLAGFFGSTTLVSIAGAHSLGFSIYANSSALLPSLQTYYANATSNDTLMDDVYSPTPRALLAYWNTPQVFPRLVLANNYSELTSSGFNLYMNNVALAQAFNFSGNDYVGYDSEDWSLTSQTEQQNQATYTQMACNYIHAAGYKFAFTPEIDVPGWGQFAQVNWTCVDFLDLQEQFLSNNPTAMVQNVTQHLAIAKVANPNLVVFVQLDMAGDSTSATQAQLQSDILALSQIPGINGVIIQDLCTSGSCNNELTTMINYLDSFSGSSGPATTTSIATTTVPTTTATTTTKTTSSTVATTTVKSTSTSSTTTTTTSSTTGTTPTTTTTKTTTKTSATTTIKTKGSTTSIATTIPTSTTTTPTTVSTTISQASTTTPTTTVEQSTGGGGSGGGSGGGGGGGGGAAFVPVVNYTNNCATISNVSDYASFSLSFGNETFNDMEDNFVGSNYTSLIVGGSTYMLYLDEPVEINNSISMELVNVSYIPILHSLTLEACSNNETPANETPATSSASAPTTSQNLNSTSASSQNSTVNSTSSTGPTVSLSFTVEPITGGILLSHNPTNAISVEQVSNVPTTPPSGLRIYSELKIDASNSTNPGAMIHVNAKGLCNVTALQPYILKNSTWMPITPFTVNASSCVVSFSIPSDPIIAFMAPVAQGAPLVAGSTALTGGATPKAASSSGLASVQGLISKTPQSSGSAAAAWIILGILAIASLAVFAAVLRYRIRFSLGSDSSSLYLS